jgi:tetratricopeptide (TPR) repeat protein
MDFSEEHPAADVSVIIPIYNAQAHLRACLDSAAQQTLERIEIICVDDCSTDESRRIAEEYAASDSRIRLLAHDINQGEGASRNAGLDNARGRFVFHLDADDTIPLNALECLFTLADTHCSDLVKGSYVRLNQDGEAESPSWLSPVQKLVNTNIYESGFLQTIPTSHCSYLYKRDFLNQHGIRYVTDLTIGLDLVTLANTLVKAEKVTLIPDVVYHYHQTGGSATRRRLSEATLLDAIKTKRTVYNILNAAQLHKAANKYLQSWPWQITEYWVDMAHTHPLAVCSTIFSQFRSLVASRVIPWQENIQPQFRYLLALVLAGRDEAAVALLKSDQISEGISNLETLNACLEFVLAQAPDDIGALYHLGKIASEQKELEKALELFQRVLAQDSQHLDSQLQLAGILRGLGRPDDAQAALGAAQRILEAGNEQPGALRRLINQNNRLAYEKTQLVVRKLKSTSAELKSTSAELKRTKRELESVYASRSWRVTAPLRKLQGVFSK